MSEMEINTNKMRDDFKCCVCGGREASGITLHQYTKGKLVKDDEYGNEVKQTAPSFRYLKEGEKAHIECYIDRCVEMSIKRFK